MEGADKAEHARRFLRPPGGDYLKKGKPISIKENTIINNNIDIHINSSNTTTINKELFSKYLINLENLGGRTKAPPFSSMLYLFIIYFIYFIPRYLVFVWRAAEPEPPPSEGGWRSPAAGASAPILTGLKISHLFTKSVRAGSAPTIILI